SNIYRMFLWVVMILGGVWLLQQLDKGEIRPLFEATATPTRSPESYILEGDANFSAGEVNAAIAAYEEAVTINPNDVRTWSNLARIKTYSSAFLITNREKKARLLDALEDARKAVELAPEDSMARAILAFTLDWNADPTLYADDPRQAEAYLLEAETQALQAIQFDNENTLALAYYAEILLDQDKWNQAEIQINQALEREDADQLMDVHRINAYVFETLGDYNLAITEYDKAIAIEPNFTFLYLRAGANYRQLALEIQNEEAARPVYDKSLEYFDRAARINEQIGVNDPVPYLSISRTYSQLGDFFAAALNVKKALSFEPTNADIYGQLGVVYFRSRNYEGSVFSLKCAIYGCSGEESCMGRGLERCFPNLDENPVVVEGLPISPNTIVYYYIYGSVRAALSRPRDNHCDEAMQTMGEVRAELDANPEAYTEARDTIISIVEAGEEICRSLNESQALPDLAVPTEVGTQPGGEMSDATATPIPETGEGTPEATLAP
ncbi:MAG: tetratricopeptide repeat protein, partial [Anaerolineales bacterium]